MGAPTAKLETVVIVSPLKVLCLLFDILALIVWLVTVPSSFWVHAGKTARYGVCFKCFDKSSISSGSSVAENELTCSLINKAEFVKQGLWRNCTLARSIESLANSIQSIENDIFICMPIKNLLWIQICAALIIVSLACSVIAIVLIALGFSHKKRQERKIKFYRATIFVLVVATLCAVVGLVLFPIMFLHEINDRGKDTWYFGWSYGIAWGAAIFLFGASVLLICDRNREELFYREQLYLNQEEDEFEENQEAKIKTLKR